MVVVWERVGDGHGRGYLYGTVKEAVLSERTRSPDLDTVGVFDRFASILCPCIVRNRDPDDPGVSRQYPPSATPVPLRHIKIPLTACEISL